MNFNTIQHTAHAWFFQLWNPAHKALLSVFHTDQELCKYAALTWFFFLFIGTVLGASKKVVVYTDFDDVFNTLVVLVFPPMGWLLANAIGVRTNTTVFYCACGVAGFLEFMFVVGLLWDTFSSNRSVLRGMLALLTKVSWSLLLVFNIMSLLGAKGKKNPQDTGLDASFIQSLICTGLCAIVIYHLVLHKTSRQNLKLSTWMPQLPENKKAA